MKLTRRLWIVIPALLIVIGGVLLMLPANPGGFTRMSDGGDPDLEPQLEESEEPVETEEFVETEEPEEPAETEEPEDTEETEPEITEEPDEPYEPILPKASIIDSSSIVVYSYDDLQGALTGGTYTNIYLGDNITMTGGITVSSSKTSFTIDGINPLDPGAGRHTLTEHSSVAILGTIYIGNAAIKDATLRNLIIIGKNFFGTIGIEPSLNVTVTYDNIQYTGPQPSYNRSGTSRFFDSVISITTNNGSSSTIEELAEARHVVLGGNVTVTGTTSISMMWFVGTGCTLTVLDHADVRLTAQNSYLIFSSGGPVNCTIGKSARLVVNARHGLFYNLDLLLHQFGTLTISENAVFEVYHGERNAATLAPTVKLRSGMTAAPGSRLIVSAQHASAEPLIWFYTSGASAVFNDPDYVALTNRYGKLFDWNTGSGAVSVTADTASYWTTAYTSAEAANFAHMPDLYWPALSGVNLVTEIPSLSSRHMLAFGRLPLALDDPAADSGVLTGETYPYAHLRLDHSSFDTRYDQADGGGLIYAALPELDYPGEVYVTAQRELLFKDAAALVLPPDQAGILAFEHVPAHMPFGNVPILQHPALRTRDVPDWTIVLTDTRDIGSEWSLYVRMSSPLTGASGDTLPGALVIDGHVLDENTHKAASGVKDTPEHTARLTWAADEGILLQTPPGQPIAQRYTARLEWLLIDGP